MGYILILSTIDSVENAKNISRVLINEKLAACVNILPQVSSIYLWDGEIVEDNEVLMIIKTKKELFKEAQNRIAAMHPYEVAEILQIDINDGTKPYLDWIEKSVK